MKREIALAVVLARSALYEPGNETASVLHMVSAPVSMIFMPWPAHFGAPRPNSGRSLPVNTYIVSALWFR